MIFQFTLAIVLISLILGALFIGNSSRAIEAQEVFLGFLTLVIITSIGRWVGLDFSAIFAGVLILALVALYRITHLKPRLGESLIAFFVSTNLITLCLWFLKNTSYKLYANPDVYGHMNLVGSLSRYKSIPLALQEWSRYTGQEFSFSLDWDAPTRSLDSAWLVSDVMIRHAVDTIYVPRIGLASLISYFPNQENLPTNFFVFWMGFGILAISFLIALLFQVLITGIFNTDKSGLDASQNGRKRKVVSLVTKNKSSYVLKISMYAIVFGLVILSPLIRIFLFEGFMPHLISYASVPAIIVASKNYLESRNQRTSLQLKSLVIVLVIVLGVYFIYLQQLPIIFGTLLIISIVRFYRGKGERRAVAVRIMFVLALMFVSFLLPGTIYQLKQIGSNSGHGAIHLGSPTPLDFLGISLSDFSARITENVEIQQQPILFDRSSGIQLIAQKIGYDAWFNSVTFVLFICLFILIVSLGFSVILFKKRFKENEILISTYLAFVFFTGLLTFYFYRNGFSALKSIAVNSKAQPNLFNEYIWLRLNGIWLVFALVVVLFFVISILVEVSKRMTGTLTQTVLPALIASFIVIWALSEFGQTSTRYLRGAIVGSPVSYCKQLKPNDYAIYLIDDSEPRYAGLALGLCGRPFHLANDPFPVLIPPQNVARQVSEFQYSEEFGTWTLSDTNFSLPSGKALQTPCKKDCLVKFKTP